MKPHITVYSSGGPQETKKLDGFISAAFWIGVDHTEGDLASVKVRLPSESYDYDVASLTEFTSLLAQRQINFSVEFFTEPPLRDAPSQKVAETKQSGSVPAVDPLKEADFEGELAKIKEQYSRGQVTKHQYESKKGEILKKWRDGLEGRLGG